MAEVQSIERTQEQWIAREHELLSKISTLEKEKENLNKEYEQKYETLTGTLTKSKEEINDLLKKITIFDKLVQELRNKQTLSQAANDGSKLNDKKEELLTKAKELLFEQTKISKNQEMQINALNTQLASIKEVLGVTREMLEIRNTEVEHMKIRMESVELRLKTERDLMERRFNISEKMYKHLKQEHDLQTDLFKELKDGYKQKIVLISTELQKEKAKIQNISTSNENGLVKPDENMPSTSKSQTENAAVKPDELNEVVTVISNPEDKPAEKIPCVLTTPTENGIATSNENGVASPEEIISSDNCEIKN